MIHHNLIVILSKKKKKKKKKKILKVFKFKLQHDFVIIIIIIIFFFLVMVLFNWVLLALTLFGLAFVFDPLGSVVFNESQPEVEALRHRKVTRLWMRRLQWFFCWICRDQHSHEAFQLIACKTCLIHSCPI